MATEIDEIVNFASSQNKVPAQDADIQEIINFVSKGQEPFNNTIAEPEEKKYEWSDVLTGALENMPSSTYEYAGQMASGITDIATHPVETIKGLYKLGQGTFQKFKEGKQDEEIYFDAMVEELKKQYGSVDNLKKSLATNPAQSLADISTIFMGVGGALKTAGWVSKSSKITKTAKAITDIGKVSEPLNLARGIASFPLKFIPKDIPNSMYQKAVKFSTSLDRDLKKTVSQTALDQEIMPTAKGMDKLKSKIDNYNTEINDRINYKSNAGLRVDYQDLSRGMNTVITQMKETADPSTYKTIDVAYAQFQKGLQQALADNPTRSPSDIQKLKVNIYKQLESMYEKQKALPAKVTIRKKVASNARQMLEDILPEIKKMNKSEGELIELWDAIESKAALLTNSDIITWRAPFIVSTGAGAGYAMAGETGAKIGTGLGLAYSIYETPQVKAKLAIVLNKLKKQGITPKNWTTISKLGFYQVGKDQIVTDEQLPESMREE